MEWKLLVRRPDSRHGQNQPIIYDFIVYLDLNARIDLYQDPEKFLSSNSKRSHDLVY